MPYIVFNYSKLRGRIAEKYKQHAAFAKALGISTRSLSLKLTGKTEFRPSEIIKAIQLLELTNNDISAYFFTLKVQ